MIQDKDIKQFVNTIFFKIQIYKQSIMNIEKVYYINSIRQYIVQNTVALPINIEIKSKLYSMTENIEHEETIDTMNDFIKQLEDYCEYILLYTIHPESSISMTSETTSLNEISCLSNVSQKSSCSEYLDVSDKVHYTHSLECNINDVEWQ